MLAHLVVVLPALIPVDSEACVPNSTDIRVVRDIKEPKVDFSHNENQLKAMDFTGMTASDPRFQNVAGLTVSSVAVDSEIRIASTRSETGQICAWPSIVTVTISSAPTIYVAADHGKCQLAAGFEHEQKHVAVDRDVVNRYAAIFRQRLGVMADAVGAAGPAPETQLSNLRNRIEEKFNAIIATTSEQMNLERSTQQRAVDTPFEYRRLSDLCPMVTMDPRQSARS